LLQAKFLLLLTLPISIRKEFAFFPELLLLLLFFLLLALSCLSLLLLLFSFLAQPFLFSRPLLGF